MTLAQSKRASELQNDINQWEENRLFRSGVVRLREVISLSLLKSDTSSGDLLLFEGLKKSQTYPLRLYVC